jgi:homoserine dehydrogenase
MVGVGRRSAPLGYLDTKLKHLEIKPISEIIGKYYLRFSALDKPGVLAKIAGVLGKNEISIESMIQSAKIADETVPIVIMTHKAPESGIRSALAEIDSFDFIYEKSKLIRIEDSLL